MTLKKSQVREEILGIKLDSTSVARVLRFVRERIKRKKKFYIVTPNPEIVISAQKDKELAKILNSADVSLPDGIGLAAAYKFLKLPNPKDTFVRFLTLFAQGLGVGFSVLFNRDWLLEDLNIIRGRQMFLEFIKLANKKGWRVFLLGGEKGVANKTGQVLSHSFKAVKIKTDTGPMLDESARPITSEERKVEKKSVLKINKFKPHLLFVAFRASKQEKWLHKWLSQLDIGGAMVVGRTFDYISGSGIVLPPPPWMANVGLEWLWTLITRPKRLGRVLTAFPIFPLRVFWSKLCRALLKF